MKTNRPYLLFVPTAVHDTICRHVRRNKENYFFIIHYILTKPVHDKNCKDDYVNINKKKVSAIINSNPYNYIKLLEKYELIESDEDFKPGIKSKHYRLKPEIKIDTNFVLVTYEQPIYKALTRRHKNRATNYSRLPSYLNEMRKAFMKITFDYAAAYKWIDGVTDFKKRLSYTIAMKQIQDPRERYFKRNRTNGRLDTNLTNLKKHLKGFIVGDFVQIDLSNSQPFLFFCLIDFLAKNISDLSLIEQTHINKPQAPAYCLIFDIKNIAKTFGIATIKDIAKIRKKDEISFNTNLSKYKDWTLNGVLYENMAKFYNNEMGREDMKKLMWPLLFSDNFNYEGRRRYIPYEKEKKVFAGVFPFIYEIIVALKRKNNRDLAVMLQRIESFIFIDCIAQKLVNAGIIPLTVHDCIIVPKCHERAAINVIKAVFKEQFNLIPTFKIEPLK
jgi:hypothetical protein